MGNKREYRLEIKAYTPETMPMKRLAEYLSDMAALLGEESSVHLIAIENGSTCPVFLVDWESEPKINDRIAKVRAHEAPAEVLEAERRLNRRLLEDNSSGNLIGPGKDTILRFPGSAKEAPLEWPSINQSKVLYGVPIAIGGKNDPVPVRLEDGRDEIYLLAGRLVAKRIAEYLFTTVLRVMGRGRWRRTGGGTWELERFVVDDFEPLRGQGIDEVLARLRGVQAGWKQLEDPLGALEEIRYGERRRA